MKNDPSPLAKAQVGAGLAMMGDRARARSAMRQAVRSLGWRDEGDWYQSPLRDTAAVVALAHEAGETRLANDLARRLELSVREPSRLNTQEQARLLQAAWFMLRGAGQIRIEASGCRRSGPPVACNGGRLGGWRTRVSATRARARCGAR
jgi:uncharacterized protein YfaS (alpha-2-macroglobulin family)